MRKGRKAVINIKLVQEGGKMIFSVKNPVAEKVPVMDGIVLDSSGGMQRCGPYECKGGGGAINFMVISCNL